MGGCTSRERQEGIQCSTGGCRRRLGEFEWVQCPRGTCRRHCHPPCPVHFPEASGGVATACSWPNCANPRTENCTFGRCPLHCGSPCMVHRGVVGGDQVVVGPGGVGAPGSLVTGTCGIEVCSENAPGACANQRCLSHCLPPCPLHYPGDAMTDEQLGQFMSAQMAVERADRERLVRRASTLPRATLDMLRRMEVEYAARKRQLAKKKQLGNSMTGNLPVCVECWRSSPQRCHSNRCLVHCPGPCLLHHPPPPLALVGEEVDASDRFAMIVERLRAALKLVRIPNDNSPTDIVKLSVHRENLVNDAVLHIETLRKVQLRMDWNITFAGESAMDAGGVSREFFHEVVSEFADPSMGLFRYSAVDNLSYQIDPSSSERYDEATCTKLYRVFGRLLGKALFEAHTIPVHFTRSLYRHLLGVDVTLDDIEGVDSSLYNSLIWMRDEDITDVFYETFTVDVTDVGGGVRTVPLRENGENEDVTNENKHEYIDLRVHWETRGAIELQLESLVFGFQEVVPHELLLEFDHHHLELLLSGLPDIDVDDWRAHTTTEGLFENNPYNVRVVDWFFEALKAMPADRRAAVLQFSTGTSRVPARGFEALQGSNGRNQAFTLMGVALVSSGQLPRAHTCFNRIDLPLYTTPEQLRRCLNRAIDEGGDGGFSIE